MKYTYSTLLSVITLLMMLCYCAKQPERATNSPTITDYMLGEKWVWKYKGVSGDGVVRSEGIDVKEIVSLNGNLGMTIGNDTTLISDMLKPNTSETPRYKWPLEVGKKWKYETDFTSAVGVKGI